MAGIRVVRISNERMRHRLVPFEYVSNSFFDIELKETKRGWSMHLEERPLEKPFRKYLKELWIQPYKGKAETYAALLEGREAGLIQVEHQNWNNSLRVWDIYVWPKFRGKGVGAALMRRCKERAMSLKARRVVLETQTSNSNALRFYIAQGFELVGMDLTNYNNDDVARKEVRLELALHLPTKAALRKARHHGKLPAKV